VLAVEGSDDFVRLLARVAALDAFLRSDDGANLLIAYRRAANIVRIEEKKDGRAYRGGHLGERAGLAEECALWDALARIEKEAGPALEREDFQSAMTAMATLRAPVDLFFDKVTVNTSEAQERTRRLGLLGQVCASMDRIADFSAIEG
jgi:glycyl-tRNA synthetase beta chain